MVTLIRKVERRFEPGDEIEQLRVEVGDLARQRTLELIEGRARLQRRRRGDEIRDRLGLDQIELAAQERAQREFAGLREPSTCVDCRTHDAA